MNLLDNYLLILFVCGFVDSQYIGDESNEFKLDNLKKKSQNIQQFCTSTFYSTNEYCGIGIIGKTKGDKCIKWKYSRWDVKDKKEHDTTFCHKHDNYYYCATSFEPYWDKCREFKCISSTSDETCQSNINWSSTSSSIEIDYSRMSTENNFLLFAYKESNGCHISKMCQNCDSSDHIVKSHFETCTLIQEKIKGEKIIHFINLSKDTKYTFYLIPVFHDASIGQMAKLSFQTTSPEPNVPSNIRMIDRTTTQITIQWNPPQQTNIYGSVTGYLIEITSKIDVTRTFKTPISYYIFRNLQPCQNYCFILVSLNDHGYSSRSESKCFSTEANFSVVILNEIDSYFSTSRLIKWRYNVTKGCPIIFTVQYYKCNSETNSIRKTTSLYHIELDGLLVHQKYCVRVRPEIDTDVGPLSSINEFYTSDKTPKIKNLLTNESFNQIDIAFDIDCSNALENSLYRFLLLNKQNKCFYQVIFLCEDCQYKFLESHLNDSQLIEYQNIKNCSIIETKNFQKSNSKFIIKISRSHFLKDEKNALISIYAINPSGLYQINKRAFISSYKQKRFPSYLYPLIIGVIILSIIIIAFIAVKKFKSSKLTSESYEIDNDIAIEKEITNTICLNPLWNITGNHSELVQELMKDKESILKEYKEITKTSQQLEREMELTNIIANQTDNKKKNRNKNILPYDQSRVLLKEDYSESDYINASLIPFEDDHDQIEYIAAQGPIESTIPDFWLMVWEQHISIIVMLTKTYENGKLNCIQYWPDELNVLQSFGIISVVLKDETTEDVYTERNITVGCEKTKKKRKIIHLQMNSWSEDSVPEFKDLESFINRFHQLIGSSIRVPYLIHCSKGVGRTGTFIVVDRIIRKLSSGNQCLNIQEEVLKIRMFRKFMVSRQTHYVFIYEFIRYFLEKYAKSSNCNEDADIYPNSDDLV